MSCPHCTGELVKRPRRKIKGTTRTKAGSENVAIPPSRVWAANLAVWTVILVAAALSVNEYNRSVGEHAGFWRILGMQAAQVVPYALMTPFVFFLACRYPVRREGWFSRSLLHVVGGSIFSVLHVVMTGLTPYAYWDSGTKRWVSAVFDPQTHHFAVQWYMLKNLFLANYVNDFMFTYVTILLVASAVSYYQQLRDRELRATQLEAQLAKAHLQSLKSQLQPHFLFNTLHSISALMLTNTRAADRMMSRLSELLRMSLDNGGGQLTSLSRELDFVNGYLEIEKVRFEERLEVVLDVSPETLDAQVPHSLLQPLVENAVRHGVSRQTAPVTIQVTARKEDRTLRLLVKDDGPGLVPGGEERKGGLGLKATRERLETLYGSAQRMEVRNAPEGGVEVAIRIPFSLGFLTYEEGADERKEEGGTVEPLTLSGEMPQTR